MSHDEPTPEEILRLYAPRCRICNELATRRGVPAEHNCTYLATFTSFTKIHTLPKGWTSDQVRAYLSQWENQIRNAFPDIKGNLVFAVIPHGRGPHYCDYCDEGWVSYEEIPIASETRKLRPQRAQKTRFDRILEDD
jgi:hypothetical protein